MIPTTCLRATQLAPPPSRLLLAGLCLAAALWSGWFIYRTSVVVEGTRTFSLFDDAMISMTYARNLTEGHGLVWAREGDPVEGFTTPLWTAVMVPLNALPVPLRYRPLVVQALAGALLIATLLLLDRLVRRFYSSGRHSTAWPALLLTASYYPLSYWSLMGMETALHTLLLVAAVYLALEVAETGANRGVRLGCVLALLYLTRMDLLPAIVTILAYVAAFGHRSGDRAGHRLRPWLATIGIPLAAAVAYQVFRQLYFGDALPNTYHLKLTGIPWEVRCLRGLATYIDFLLTHGALLSLLGIGILPLLKRHRRFRLPVALFVVASLYSVFVGGDAWEADLEIRSNRFLAPTIPLLFVAFTGLLNHWTARWKRSSSGRPPGGVLASARVAATLVVFLTANGLWLADDSRLRWRTLAVVEQPMLVGSHAKVLGDLDKLEAAVAPGARVASFWAGIPAYFSDYRMVDLFGYSDRHIARLPPAIPLGGWNFERYIPGHVKWDHEYVLSQRRPDAFLQAWGLERPNGPKRLTNHGYVPLGDAWVRRQSPWLYPAARQAVAEVSSTPGLPARAPANGTEGSPARAARDGRRDPGHDTRQRGLSPDG